MANAEPLKTLKVSAPLHHALTIYSFKNRVTIQSVVADALSTHVGFKPAKPKKAAK